MTAFMDGDFLLDGKTAESLYRRFAEDLPIIDYHCHINPAEIYENKRFTDLADAWLGGDHYKWRLMRALGAGENLVTGGAPGWEKFKVFAQALPQAAGNPVYHWAHLELRRFFGCDTPLGPDTARDVWDFCNDKLRNDEGLRVRGVIRRMNVEAIVTTDDPADSLEWHEKLAGDQSFATRVLPGWRPGGALGIESDGFPAYIDRLGHSAGAAIKDYDGLRSALLDRMAYFHARGCPASDHGINWIRPLPAGEGKMNELFTRRMRGEALTPEEADQFRYGLLLFSAKEYSRLGWVMELHLGVARDVNTVMYNRLGQDTGYDRAGKDSGMDGLAMLLDELEQEGSLPKTIIFSVDPGDNLAINTLAGCFTQEGVRGKVQQGSAWWFNDSPSGIKRQIVSFAETGALGSFVGMLTDSRSFLSYTRHEYFRRILCGILGRWADKGLYPGDMDQLGGLIQDICYRNAKNFFSLALR